MKRKIIERTRNTMKMELVWTSMERMVRPARDPDTEEREGERGGLTILIKCFYLTCKYRDVGLKHLHTVHYMADAGR